MMDTNSDKVATDSVAETLPPLSVGKILSEERTKQGLSIADVAGRIKFAPRQVEALEADDFNHLPELAFVRGFVRSYARLLHLDETPLLDALPQAHRQLSDLDKEMGVVPFPSSQSTRGINIAWLSAAFGLAVLLGLGIWLFQDKPDTNNEVRTPVPEAQVVIQPALAASAVEPVQPVSAVVAAAPQETPAAVVANPEKPIHLVFQTESWVDIKDRVGKTVFKQINPPNTEQWVGGRAPFSLVIGNASGVRLYYQGEEVDLADFTEVEVARLILEE
jgi:cytoskeleton protein RodZ